VAVRKLSEWLSTDALTFVFYFVGKEEPAPLAPELALLKTLLQEQIETKTVEIVEKATPEQAERDCALRARRSLCHCLPAATRDVTFSAADTVVTRLRLDGPYPALGTGDDEPAYPEAEEPMEGWEAALKHLLQLWV
jgi:hypothetical protein